MTIIRHVEILEANSKVHSNVESGTMRNNLQTDVDSAQMTIIEHVDI